MPILGNLQPTSVFRYFERLSGIPHGSRNTKQISDAIVAIVRAFPWAKGRADAVVQDAANNLMIRKPASPGCENAPAVILQGHLDMVCAKTSVSPIDMTKEPIRLVTDGEWVSAQSTSLGGDDLIAVAVSLAILEDDSIVHPPLEVVFTSDEEIGMLGATALDCSSLRGRILLNMDSEASGVFTVGCAGGVRVHGTFPVAREAIPADSAVRRVTVSGLLGGHSGEQIGRERGNANCLLARILWQLLQVHPIRVASFSGGQFDNVICPTAEAVVTWPADKAEQILSFLREQEAILRNELAASDPGLTITVDAAETADVLTEDDTNCLLQTIVMMPNGVQAMNPAVPGAVQTSLNLGIVRLGKDSFITDNLIRSSVNTQKDYLLQKLTLILTSNGGAVELSGDYPAWPYVADSLLREVMCESYREMTGREPLIEVIHAGVECGILAAKLPGLDAVSYGPDLKDIHSPNERLNVASVAEMWKLTLSVLKKLAETASAT